MSFTQFLSWRVPRWAVGLILMAFDLKCLNRSVFIWAARGHDIQYCTWCRIIHYPTEARNIGTMVLGFVPKPKILHWCGKCPLVVVLFHIPILTSKHKSKVEIFIFKKCLLKTCMSRLRNNPGAQMSPKIGLQFIVLFSLFYVMWNNLDHVIKAVISTSDICYTAHSFPGYNICLKIIINGVNSLLVIFTGLLECNWSI